MPPEPADLARRGMAGRMSQAEWDAVVPCFTEIRNWPARALVSRRGEPLDRSLFLIEGWVGRYVPGPYRDLRNMVALEIAGDFVDLHSFPIGTLDHDVTAMTDVRMAVLPHDRLHRLVSDQPEIAVALWAQTICDAAIHRYWSFRIAALRAAPRVANFLCELQGRLDLAGLADQGGFDLPLTQNDLGEACGMSAVHVNRVLRELREAKCCIVRNGRVTILDLGELRRVGQYDPDVLNFGRRGPTG